MERLPLASERRRSVAAGSRRCCRGVQWVKGGTGRGVLATMSSTLPSAMEEQLWLRSEFTLSVRPEAVSVVAMKALQG